jgi:hypothetical protein
LLCTYPLHRIDFLEKNDKYNPFSEVNKYAQMKLALEESLYDKIADFMLCSDLNDTTAVASIEKSHILSDAMYAFLKTKMEEKKIEFKPSSKYFMQTAFARMSLKNMHSKLTFFYQLIGTMHKKKVNFTSLAFLRCLSHALDS